MIRSSCRGNSTLKQLKLTMGKTENPITWLDKCLSVAETNSSPASDLIGKWFEKFIFFTGDSQLIKEPVCKLETPQLQKIEDILLKTGNLSTHSKVVKYHLDLLKSNRDLAEFNHLRHKSRLDKFKYHFSQLGALKVIENGMFNQFSFPLNTKYTLEDFEFLCRGIAEETKNRKWTLERCIYLMEQMHGFHTKKSPNTYHKGLAPDIQIARIMNCSLRRNPNDEDLQEEYNELIAGINIAQKRENKPKKQSSGQRNRKISSHISPRFGKLPLNIIIRSMWVQQEMGNFKSDMPMHEIAFRLISVMKRSRDTRPNQQTLALLILMFDSESQLRGNLPQLIDNFKRHCPMNASVTSLLGELGYDDCGNIKNTT